MGSNAWKNNGFFSKVDGYDALNPPTPDGATPKPTAVKALSGLKQIDDLTFSVKLKVPFSLVTCDCAPIIEGLVAVTVTPGSTAPLASVTRP